MSAAPSPNVQVRTEALRRILSTTAASGSSPWEFSLWDEWSDSEPRIRDVDASARLGYSQPRQVRELIKRIWPEGKRPACRAAVARTSMPRGGTREVKVTEYWLTEAELLKLCARSETPIAEAILDEMIAVYMAVRHHLAVAIAVKAHERKLPSPRPRTVIARPVAPSFETFREQTEYPWSELSAALRHPHAGCPALAAEFIEALGDWPVPPGVKVTPALLRETALLRRDHTAPAPGRRLALT